MKRKVFVFGLGTIVLSPIFFALASDNLFIILVAGVYAYILYITGKVRFRKFWREFWKIQIEICQTLESTK